MAIPWLAIINAAQNTGGAFFDAVPYIIKTDYEKENKQRLAELSRKRELDALGLTEEEKQKIAELYSAPVQAAQEQSLADQRRILASQAGTGAGQGMNQLQRNDAALNKAMEAKTKAIQAADDQRKAEEEAEYWGRLAWQSQKKQERVAAWSSIGKAAIKGKQEQGALNELTGSNSSSNQTMASSDVSSFAKQYGMSEAEAQQYLQILQDNPQLVEDLAKMNK